MTKGKTARYWRCITGVVLGFYLSAGPAFTEAIRQAAPTGSLAVADRLAGQIATLLPDGLWLVTGGKVSGDASAGVYLEAAETPTQVRDSSLTLNTARTNHTATVLPDGTVLVFGGTDTAGHVLADAEIIDLSANRVSSVTINGLVPRSRHTATLLTDGRVLFAGGVDEQGAPIAAAQLWDPKTNAVDAWNPQMLTPRFDHSASLQSSGEGLVSGGHSPFVERLPNEAYNPTTNVFEPADSQVDPRVALSTGGHTAPVIAQSLPASDAVDVPVDTRIAIRFSEPVTITDLNSANMTVVGPSGAIAGKIVGAEGGRLAFFTPAIELAPGTTYTAFIQGVKDPSGAALAASTVRFTTHRYEAPQIAQAQSSLVITPAAVKPAATTTAAVVNTPRKSVTSPKSTAPAAKPDTQKTAPPTEVVEDWIPSAANRQGQWRVLGLSGDPALAASALSTAPLSAPAGQPGVAGHVVRVNGEPLAGIAVSVGTASTVTDASGRFLLTNVGSGSQQLLVDGTAVQHNGRHYTKHYIHVTVSSTQTLVLNEPIYLSRVNPASEVAISSPASQEIVLTHPLMPGLEVHIPAGTVLREANGKIVTKVSITPIAIDRAPYPTPRNFSAYFTLQPGGAFVDGDASHAIKVVYPNYTGLAPGSKANFYNYDPNGSGWVVYGQGTVSKDGTQITPDNGTGFRQIMGFGLGIGKTASPTGPPVGGNCNCGDPVDLATGFFTHTETDMAIADVIPISVTRTYMSNDPGVHAFGPGTNFTYAMHLTAPDSNNDVYLVMSDGSQVHYVLQSTSPDIWKNLDSPSEFYGSVMQYVPGVNGQINLTQDLITVTMPNQSMLTFASDGNQNQLLSMADSNGNTVRITLSSGRSGNISQVTSPNGRYISFLYDGCNRVSSATDNLGRTVGYTYVSPTVCTSGLYQVTDQNNKTESFAYDTSNRLQSMTDKNGNRVFYNVYYAYTAGGANTTTTQANQVQTQTLADGALWQFAYTVVNGSNVTTVTNPRSYQNQYTFNASGYLTNQVLAMGQPEQQTYSITRYGSNLLYTVVDQLSRETMYNWDAYGNLTSLQKLVGTSNAVTYQFGYDPVFHQLASYTDPLGHQTQWFYDNYGKLNQVTNALSNSWKLLNNAQGLPTQVTDPLNNISKIRYEQADVSSVTDGLGRQSTLYTDEVGRVVRAADPLSDVFQYGYDNRDQLLTVTDPNNGTTTIGYDPNGNVTSVEDPRNLAAHGYTPDSRNRVHIYKDPLGNTETYNYDGMSNLTSKVDRKNQTTQYQYDGINRLHVVTYNDGSTLTINWDGGNRPQSFVDTVNGTITQQYDGLDRLHVESGPQGTITYNYDNGDRRSNVTIAGQANPLIYNFDAANRLKSITQGGVVVGWNYDTANRFTGIQLPNGITSTVVPDAANEIQSITYNLGATVVGNVTYGYDGAGRRSSASGSLVRPLLDAALSGTTYDAANHLTQLATGALAYDANGNLSTQAASSPASYTWNDRNQLTSTSNGTVLQYDALGRLVTRTQGTASTSFMYDGGNQVLVNGNLMIRGTTLDEVETQVTPSGTINYLTDGLGSASMLTDSNGNVTTLYSYGAYGATATTGVSGAATVDTSFKYTGADYNAVDDLYYFRNRYYSPHLQRFISDDPIGLNGGLNVYAYAAGNPVSFRDPTGLAVYVGQHGAFFPGDPLQHAAIVLVPDNPTDFANFALFQATGGQLATLGGQPSGYNGQGTDQFGNLISEGNYPGDSPCNLHDITRVPTPQGMTDSQFILQLLREFAAYGNNLAYDPFPLAWTNTYNSNGFVSGLLIGAGATPPNLPGIRPGYGNPIPVAH